MLYKMKPAAIGARPGSVTVDELLKLDAPNNRPSQDTEQVLIRAELIGSDGRASDDDDTEWERGFDETCDKARRERSREIIEAELERLALLTSIDYEIERKPAAERLQMRPAALDALVKARRPKKATKAVVPEIDPDELQRTAGHIIKHPDILNLFAEEFSKVIAGEAVNGKLLYLVATSRLFDKPMSGLDVGNDLPGIVTITMFAMEQGVGLDGAQDLAEVPPQPYRLRLDYAGQC